MRMRGGVIAAVALLAAGPVGAAGADTRVTNDKDENGPRHPMRRQQGSISLQPLRSYVRCGGLSWRLLRCALNNDDSRQPPLRPLVV